MAGVLRICLASFERLCLGENASLQSYLTVASLVAFRSPSDQMDIMCARQHAPSSDVTISLIQLRSQSPATVCVARRLGSAGD